RFQPGGEMLDRVVVVQVGELVAQDGDLGRHLIDAEPVLHHEPGELVAELAKSTEPGRELTVGGQGRERIIPGRLGRGKQRTGRARTPDGAGAGPTRGAARGWPLGGRPPAVCGAATGCAVLSAGPSAPAPHPQRRPLTAAGRTDATGAAPARSSPARPAA